MKERVAFVCLLTALGVWVLGLAACGGGSETQLPNGQDDQGAQPSPSPAQGAYRAASGLIGTWEGTSLNGVPLEPGEVAQTFSEDGTYESISIDFWGGM